MFYFAYGSNMLRERLVARTPSAVFHALGWVRGYSLRFHKAGDDGSGKADAFHTGARESKVHGVIYNLDPSEKVLLDRIEGVDEGYRVTTVEVITAAGPLTCFLYVAEETYHDSAVVPFDWYKDFALFGAIQNGLPRDYIDVIAAIPARPDPDAERAAANRAILKRVKELD